MTGEKPMETRAALEARFGPDPAEWPAPFRAALAAGDDGLLVRALLVAGDEVDLTRAVLTKLARPEPGLLASLLPLIVPPRLALTGYAALWLLLAVLGYQLAGGLAGDLVLDLALGQVPGWEIVQ